MFYVNHIWYANACVVAHSKSFSLFLILLYFSFLSFFLLILTFLSFRFHLITQRITFFISQSLSKYLYLFSRYYLHFLQTSNTCPVFFRYLQGSAFLIEIIVLRLNRKQREQSCLFWNAKPSMVSATLLINHRVKRSLPARRRCLVGRFFFFLPGPYCGSTWRVSFHSHSPLALYCHGINLPSSKSRLFSLS